MGIPYVKRDKRSFVNNHREDGKRISSTISARKRNNGAARMRRLNGCDNGVQRMTVTLGFVQHVFDSLYPLVSMQTITSKLANAIR